MRRIILRNKNRKEKKKNRGKKKICNEKLKTLSGKPFKAIQ